MKKCDLCSINDAKFSLDFQNDYTGTSIEKHLLLQLYPSGTLYVCEQHRGEIDLYMKLNYPNEVYHWKEVFKTDGIVIKLKCSMVGCTNAATQKRVTKHMKPIYYCDKCAEIQKAADNFGKSLLLAAYPSTTWDVRWEKITKSLDRNKEISKDDVINLQIKLADKIDTVEDFLKEF